jgi:hypothetical protein
LSTNTRVYRTRAQAIAVRRDACMMAAEVMASRPADPVVPTLRALAVFFESYMTGGFQRTAEYGQTRKAAKLIPIAGGKGA